MSELLTSIKDDLLDRRLLPLVGVVAVCLIGAVAYAVLGGSGEAGAPTAKSTVAPATSGLAVSTTKPETAVAETTDGVREQHGGKARNPFTPLPGSGSSTSAAAKSSTGSGSASGSSSGSSGASSGSGTSGSGSSGSSGSGSSGSKPAKPAQQYAVTIKLGVVPQGSSPEAASLSEFANLALNSPLPNAKQALLVFRGVTAKGKSATFTVVSEVILHGVGSCLPSATQCQAVDLQPGDSEQLEYIQGDGEPIVYELKVVSIAPINAKASAARRRTAFAQSQAGTALLRRDGLVALPDLRWSSQPGVLVFPRRGAFSARAHASRRGHRH